MRRPIPVTVTISQGSAAVRMAARACLSADWIERGL